jgi:hypothetical protein
VRWHVVDGIKAGKGANRASHLKGAVTGHIPAASEGATLIGFFSRDHAGAFTHHGSFSHFHRVCPSPMVAAHLDAVTPRKGAVLHVPSP